VTIEQARQQMATIGRRLEMQYPDSQTGRGVRVMPFAGRLGWIHSSAVAGTVCGCGVRIADCLRKHRKSFAGAWSCTKKRDCDSNVVGRRNVEIGSAIHRREFVTRNYRRLCGLVLAKFGVSLLTTLGAGILPRINEIGLDWQVVGFTGALALITGICFGFVPAFQAMRVDIHGSLKQSGLYDNGRPR